MNVMQDNIEHIKKDFATKKPMTVKPTVIGNSLMPPPSNAVQKIVTPSSSRSRAKGGFGSSTSHTKSSSTVHRNSHVIVSVCEGRGKATGIVGIAAIDIHRPVLILSQFSDNNTYTATLTKINILCPVEVVVPATFIEGATVSRLVTVIMDQFPNLSVSSVSRSEFNWSRGLHIMQSLCAPVFSSVILQIKKKFYASAASCALLKYVESKRTLYSPKTIKIEYQEPEHTTGIDIGTAYLLELVSTTAKQNLFTVLNYCSTTPGKKLLRTNILQPPRRKNVIETRLDCIQELIENASLLTQLQETLKPLSDIEASLTFGTVVPATASSVSERQLNYTLQLKGLLNAIQPLADELKVMKHPVFREIYNRFEGIDTRKKILDLISEVVNDDAHLAKGQAGELQRCFALKSGINGFLDLARRMYTEEVDSMRSYVDELSNNYNLPLRVQHTIKNGFYINLPLTKALRNLKKTDLPPVFIKSERFTTHFYLNTMDMINFDSRLKNTSTEIQNISNVLIYKLLVDIRPFIGDLYHLCDDVAQLDMLVSLARASSVANWVRPHLVDTHLYLEGARHPILEHAAHQDPVSNTIYAYPRSRLHIITGPNMSGKTILLHTTCLVQVLAQMGCWVPCTRATVRIADKVFANVAEDELALTGSSFSLETTKLAYLFATLTDTSLVVLDELCKTTSCDEGVAFAIAVCEKMLKTQAFIFVASHFMGVTKMADMYPYVLNWYMETLEENRANNTRISLKFTYKYLPGVTSIDLYGIKLSRMCTSSKSISDRAEELYRYLESMKKSLSSNSASSKPKFLKYKLQAELDLLKIQNQLTEDIQKDKITNFQNKTGLSFEPSPLTIETNSNSVLLNQSSSNDNINTISTEKKRSSDSNWIPTPSNKSTMTSNHQFSIPTSMKTSSNLNQRSHIFSFDHEPKTPCALEETYSFDKIDSFHSYDGNITFPQDGELSSIHRNVSYNSEDFLPASSFPNKNVLFPNLTNNEAQSQNLTFPEFHMSLGKILFESSNRKSKSTFSQDTNWSSAENTLINNQPGTINLVVNSTPSTKQYLSQKRDIEVQNTPFLSDNFSQRLESSNNFNINLRLPVPSKINQSSSSQENSGHNFQNTFSLSQENFDQRLQSSNFQSNNFDTLRTNEIVKTPVASKNVTFNSNQENFGHNFQKTSSLSQENFDQRLQSSNFQSNNFDTLRTNEIVKTSVASKNVTFNSNQENSAHNFPKSSSLSQENFNKIIENASQSNNFNISLRTNEIVKTPVVSKNVTFNSNQENSLHKFRMTSNSSILKTGNNLPTNKISKTPLCKIQNSSFLKTDNSSTSSQKPLTASILDTSSPILSRKQQTIPKNIPETVSFQLVSKLYDTSSESENSDENDKNSSNNSIIIIEDEENSFPDSSLPDEVNFETYLNLRQGVTSTPIRKENETVVNQDISLINNTTNYYTANMIDTNIDSTVNAPETFVFNKTDSSFESPILKRKWMPQHKILPKKKQKIAVPSPSENSSSLFRNSSFKSCVNSSDLTNCSTTVIIGQNKKIAPFLTNVVSSPNINEQAFEHDIVSRQNRSSNFRSNDSN